MTVIALCITTSGAAGVPASSADSRAQETDELRVTASVTCRSARKAVRWYRGRHADWLKLRGVPRPQSGRTPRSCADARYLAGVAKSRSFKARTGTERWISSHVLTDFRVVDGARAWHRAVQEAQRPYPDTEAWLMSCSASEGGWGRWVPNSQGSGVGGWLQFHPGTFAGFSWRARVDAASRGFIVPGSASSWYSPLGQALAGGWAITNGRRHHWVGAGC